MLITDKTYIYPPRTKTLIPLNEVQYLIKHGWIYQYKINDSRCLIKIQPNKIELWNRHAEKFRTYTPTEELREQLQQLTQILQLDKNKIHLLDGGLIHQKHQSIKNTITIWDILVKNSTHLLGISYEERYNLIAQGIQPYTHDGIPLGLKLTENIFHLINNPQPTIEQTWATVQQINAPYTIGKPGTKNYKISPILEAIVWKDPQAPLEMGLKPLNNNDWMCKTRIITGRHNL
jgi:ATP-dependent DNA ligase